jgi:hypothetical protein
MSNNRPFYEGGDDWSEYESNYEQGFENHSPEDYEDEFDSEWYEDYEIYGKETIFQRFRRWLRAEKYAIRWAIKSQWSLLKSGKLPEDDIPF